MVCCVWCELSITGSTEHKAELTLYLHSPLFVSYSAIVTEIRIHSKFESNSVTDWGKNYYNYYCVLILIYSALSTSGEDSKHSSKLGWRCFRYGLRTVIDNLRLVANYGWYVEVSVNYTPPIFYHIICKPWPWPSLHSNPLLFGFRISLFHVYNDYWNQWGNCTDIVTWISKW